MREHPASEGRREDLLEIEEYPVNYVTGEDGNIIYDEVPGTVYKRPREAPLTGRQESDTVLAAALAAPVYDEYSGFAGDFSVSGHVVWDAKKRTVKMDGSETEYVPFEKSL